MVLSFRVSSNSQPCGLHRCAHLIVNVEQEVFGDFERSDQGVRHAIFKRSGICPAAHLDLQGVSLAEGDRLPSLKYFVRSEPRSCRPQGCSDEATQLGASGGRLAWLQTLVSDANAELEPYTQARVPGQRVAAPGAVPGRIRVGFGNSVLDANSAHLCGRATFPMCSPPAPAVTSRGRGGDLGWQDPPSPLCGPG